MNISSMALAHKQRGAALVVALILLAIILVVGLSAGSMTQNEEQMTTGFYDREVTFQAAESALRDAQEAIDGWADLDEGDLNSFDCTSQFCENLPTDNLSNRTGTTRWQSVSANELSSVVETGTTRYFIDKVAEVVEDPGDDSSRNAANLGYTGSLSTVTTSYIYRVTAKSGGGTGRAAVMLQAYIKRLY